MTEQEIVQQRWEESERGWGVRPDGFSLHLSDEDRTGFIEEYWESMPDEVPDEYSRPSGEPGKSLAPDEVLEKLRKNKEEGGRGIRIY